MAHREPRRTTSEQLLGIISDSLKIAAGPLAVLVGLLWIVIGIFGDPLAKLSVANVRAKEFLTDLDFALMSFVLGAIASFVYLQLKAVRDEVARFVKAEKLFNIAEIYAASRWLVAGLNNGGPLLGTDFRFVERAGEETVEQTKFVEEIGEYLKKHHASWYRRAIGTCSAERDALVKLCKAIEGRLLDAKMKEDGKTLSKNTHLDMRYYRQNPICIDFLMNDSAVLLVLSTARGQPRTGILLRDRELATKVREWYNEVVWGSTAQGLWEQVDTSEQLEQIVRAMPNG